MAVQLSESAINLFWWRPKFLFLPQQLRRQILITPGIFYFYIWRRGREQGLFFQTSQELRMPSIVKNLSKPSKIVVKDGSRSGVLNTSNKSLKGRKSLGSLCSVVSGLTVSCWGRTDRQTDRQ